MISWTREAVFKLIELYELYVPLYDSTHKHYSNKQYRCLTYAKIAHKLRPMAPDIKEADIRAKLHSLRTQYCTQMRKKSKIKSEMGVDERPVPYWFGKLSFLQPHITMKERKPQIPVDDPISTWDPSEDSDESMSPELNVTQSTYAESEDLSEVLSPENTTINTMEDRSLAFDAETHTFGEYVKAEVSTIASIQKQRDLRHMIINVIYDFKKNIC